MDYEFRLDPITGKVISFLSMDHEAIGRWLDDEINGNLIKLDEITRELNSRKEYRSIGREFTLTLYEGEITIAANVLTLDSDLPEDLNYYDAEGVAICGLEDFLQLIRHYCRFVMNR